MVPKLNTTENELIEGCLSGDRLAQKALYEKYKRAMYSLAYRITGDFDAANDVLQDAFIKVYRGLPSFRRESTLGAWIKTIVVRTAYSKIKKEKQFLEPIENIPADKVVDWGDFLQAEYLEKAIMDLPQGYRTIFMLIEVEGYSHKEVADLMDISVGTGKSQLFYAKRKLRAALKDYGY
ncbi:MAG: RNA polymerase sigma factor [Phaeodactylibacter sp.]|nr:RNA polymerase sigma factor [Phaeodactylibacter sp.]